MSEITWEDILSGDKTDTKDPTKKYCAECDTLLDGRNRSGFCKECRVKQTGGIEGLFDFLEDIKFHKKGNLLNEQTKGKFDPFMILRFLSMNTDILWLVNIINHYQETMSKEQIYQFLVDIIPKHANRFKYIKKSKQEIENSEFVQEYYQISPKEANDYIEILGQDWADQIKTYFGGMK